MNKNLLIIGGAVAVGLIGYFLYKNGKSSVPSSNSTASSPQTISPSQQPMAIIPPVVVTPQTTTLYNTESYTSIHSPTNVHAPVTVDMGGGGSPAPSMSNVPATPVPLSGIMGGIAAVAQPTPTPAIDPVLSQSAIGGIMAGVINAPRANPFIDPMGFIKEVR